MTIKSVLTAVVALALVAGAVWFFALRPAPSMDGVVQNEEEATEENILSEKMQNSCTGFLTAVPREIETIPDTGAAWTRPHPGPFAWGFIETQPGTFDFSRTDAFVKTAQENDVAIVATIWPFAEWDQKGESECRVPPSDQFYPRGGSTMHGIPEYRCAPQDKEAYAAFLEKLVERYDGDGSDDMPGLEVPVRYWEVLNEPAMRQTHLTFFKEGTGEYLELLKTSYTTIKETCSGCKVLHGGVAAAEPFYLLFWDNVYAAGGGDYFDIANIHHIEQGDTATLNVEPLSRLLEKYDLQKPIWVTEAQFADAEADVLNATRGAFEAGAEKVFYVSFEAGKLEPPQPGVFSPVYQEAARLCEN